MLQAGDLLEGKYRILSEIGHGGMSTVFLALNERANKTWAVKEVCKESRQGAETALQSLTEEAELLKSLNNPHLPGIVDILDTEESIIIVMDYIQGKDLQKVLEEEQKKDPESHGAMDPEAVRAWGIQLCEVLDYLHRRNPPIIYRDLKPANIMLQEERPDFYPFGSVVLIDFGTAREQKSDAAADTVWLGTRGYAAPEQFGGQGETDPRTDIFNLGATMYHLLTGYSPAETNYAFCPLGELRPDLTGSGMERIVARCCEAAREKRYQSAEELRFDLENEQALSASRSRVYRRRWLGFWCTVFTALAAAVCMAGFLILGKTARETSYDAYVSRAKNAETVQDGEKMYRKAIRIDPGKPEAYKMLVESVIADNLIKAEEREVLEKCLNSTPDDRVQANADLLKQANPAEYDRLMYEIGTAYFFYYENDDGYQYAAQKLGNILNNVHLSSGNREAVIRESLYLIADYCVKQKQDAADRSWIHGSKAMDLWNAFTELTDDPEKAIARCGTKRIATAMYRELAKQLLHSADLYRNAGVDEKMMDQAVASAREFMEKFSIGSFDNAYDRELNLSTIQAIDAASFAVDCLFHETGSNQ